MNLYTAFFSEMDSVIGKLTIVSFKNKLCMIEFEKNEKALVHIQKRLQKKFSNVTLVKNNNEEVIIETKRQLGEYFRGERTIFDLPILIIGTPFQESVWQQLQCIPYGSTKTYKDIAIEIGNDKAVRAVGGANNKNALPIVIPCHRVVGSNKKLVGFAGGLDVKEKLLQLENINMTG